MITKIDCRTRVLVDEDDYDAIQEWLDKNTQHLTFFRWGPMRVHFEDKEEAMRFKLAFGIG